MKKYLNLIVLLISITTILSGIVQLIVPGFVMELTGASVSGTSTHFFAIIGMFMTLFGGLMIQAVYSKGTGAVAIFWSALQKLGASVAVFVGILKGLFAIQAGAVACFDLFSGLLFLYYLKYRQRSESN